jgi:hypothetical protein
VKIEDGQTWLLRDEDGGETIALVLAVEPDGFQDVIEVLILASTLPDCHRGTKENFTASWFTESGSLLSQTR